MLHTFNIFKLTFFSFNAKMFYKCKDCHLRLSSIKALCCHLQIIHLYNVFSVYKCAHDDCSREYHSIKTFRKHLKIKHPAPMFDEVPLDVPNVFNQVNENIELNFNLQQIDNDNVDNNDNDELDEQVENMHDVVFTALDFKKAVFESSKALVAKLYASTTLNRSHVQEIIELISEFVSGNFIIMLKSKTLTMLREADQRRNNMQHLIEMFNTMQNIFEGLETEAQRINALKASQFYICPQSYRIGVVEKMKNIKDVGVLTPVELIGQHISIKHVLKEFLELPGVFEAILANIENLNNSDTFTNIIQSPLWKDIKELYFRENLVLPLFLYFDDVEPDNHTGSHAGDLLQFTGDSLSHNSTSLL